VSEPEEKLRAFNLLVDALEPEPGPVKEKRLGPERLGGVAIVRGTATGWSGKKGG
jgi:hypothetical protein